MRRALAVGFLGMLLLTFLVGTFAQAESTEDLLIRLLVKKGILTEEEIQALKKEAEATTPAISQPAPGDLVDTLRDEVREDLQRHDEESIALSLTVEGEGRWRARQDVGNKNSGSTSDLFLRRALLGFEAKVTDFALARLALTSEWLGAQTTDQGQVADESVTVDEGTLTLAKEGYPLYAVVGKRTQPFGAFFPRLVTDPMSQDAYEVKGVGATLGFRHPGTDRASWGKDFSFTFYRGKEQLNHFFESGLFDPGAVVRSTSAGFRRETKQFSSFILSSTLSPNKDLALGTAYLSEPGESRRNQTGAIWAGYTWGRWAAETEFLAALSRERYVLQSTGERFGTSFKEKVLVLGLSYKPTMALELATRYERLWDNGLADAAETWSARNRLSLGAGYTLYEREDVGVRLLGEYRFTDYRRGGAAREVAAPSQNEAFMKLIVSYK